MNVQAVTTGMPGNQTAGPLSQGADAIERGRNQAKRDEPGKDTSRAPEKNQIQPEELLQNIKALTDNGTYSVRFEMNKDTEELVINLIDRDTGEVIRQIPPEEILGLHKTLKDLSGNLVETQS